MSGYKKNLFVTYGIAQADLCVQVSTLGIQQVHVSDDTVDVLKLGQVQCTLGRLFQAQTGIIDFFRLVEGHDGVAGIFEGVQHCFFVTVYGLLVGSFLGFQVCPVLSHGKQRLEQGSAQQVIRRAQQVFQLFALGSQVGGQGDTRKQVGECHSHFGIGRYQRLFG